MMIKRINLGILIVTLIFFSCMDNDNVTSTNNIDSSSSLVEVSSVSSSADQVSNYSSSSIESTMDFWDSILIIQDSIHESFATFDKNFNHDWVILEFNSTFSKVSYGPPGKKTYAYGHQVNGIRTVEPFLDSTINTYLGLNGKRTDIDSATYNSISYAVFFTYKSGDSLLCNQEGLLRDFSKFSESNYIDENFSFTSLASLFWWVSDIEETSNLIRDTLQVYLSEISSDNRYGRCPLYGNLEVLDLSDSTKLSFIE